jgi:PiT family inorganic phosphate transporter
MLLTGLLYPLFRFARERCGVTRTTCVCIGGTAETVMVNSDGTVALARTGLVLTIAETAECVERYHGNLLGVRVGPLLDGLHYLSGGAVGFARGLNDTPKIVALLIAGEALGSATVGLALVALLMAAGGVLNARKVAETMSRKITRMNAGQGVTANLVTAALVTAASRLGLPVSTTHVSVGGLFGIGLVNGTARARTVRNILVAWVTTLPCAAVLAVAAYLAAGLF